MTEWVIPCDPNAYDVIGAFSEFKKVGWKQSTHIAPGDLVYIYVGYSYGAIKFKCLVHQTDLDHVDIDDSKYDRNDANYGNCRRYMVLEWLEKYDTPLFRREQLLLHGLKQVQGPSRVSEELSRYLRDAVKAKPQLPGRKKEKLPPVLRNGQKIYPRSQQTAENALLRAGYACEINPDHPSFIRKNSDRPYMEPHHLVPLAYFERFDVSLDVEDNIVCLCSNCHNEIHYGKYAGFLIEKLYKARKERLEQAGIAIPLETLLNMYP